ncbi:MAG: aminopeptidase [Candidatus Omnitrophota bacterium]
MVTNKALKAIFNDAMTLKNNESCLIITDTQKEPIGRVFYDFAKSICKKTDIIVIPPAGEHGQEPSPDVAEKMMMFDVQFYLTSKSLSHTKARCRASENGARIASMPAITADIINRCCTVSYKELKEASKQLHGRLSKAKLIRITTALGTDITFESGDSKWFGENGGILDFPGAFGNLPEGEVSFSPYTSNGRYVVDASFPDLGVLKSPLFFQVKDNYVQDIQGEFSGVVRARLDKVGAQAYRVAELGIGLNPKAKIIGIVLEDEKVKGTAHIAVGNNLSYGGANDVPLHLDGVILTPTITLDGKVLIQAGQFC